MSILSLILGIISIFCLPAGLFFAAYKQIINLAIFALLSLLSLGLGMMGKTRNEKCSTSAIVINGVVFGLLLIFLITLVFH